MPFFSNLLKPPAYLKLPTFGLDISDRSFKYITFKAMPQGFRVEHHHTGEIPAGLITNGVIQDIPALADILRSALSSLPYRHAALALPEEKGFIRTIRMPRIAPEELREAVTLQLEEYVPLPPEETAFDYHLLPTPSDSKTINVLIAAFPSSVLAGYKSVLEQAGFMPTSFEIESQAIARSIIPSSEYQETVLVIDIGLTRTSFLFAKDGYAQFTSTIPLGGTTMHAAIAKTLQIDEAQAEQIKKDHGLSRTKESMPIFEALLPVVQEIKEEVQRRTQFWKDEMGADVSRVYLCGRDANLTGLPRHLSSQLNIPVALANVWINAITSPEYVPEIEFRDSLGYATSIGLALGGMENT